jgi:hypothetical protein
MNGNKQVAATLSEEARAHVERTSRLRFRRNLIAGISGPVIFGMVVAISNNIVAIAGSTLMLTGLGIGAAIFAVGCLYLNSRLDSRISQFEQEYQATQIAKGINGPAPTIEQKPITFPAQGNAPSVADMLTKSEVELATNKPSLVVNNVTNLGRTVAPRLEPVRGQA